jgi:hypothetical protein
VAEGSIRDLWQEAGCAGASSTFFLPAWTRRVSIDVGLEVVEKVFPDIRLNLFTGRFRFPTPDPVIAWAKSLRAGTEDEIDHETRDAGVAELRTRIEQRIDQCGHFGVGKITGVIIARSYPAPNRRLVPQGRSTAYARYGARFGSRWRGA